LRRTDSGADGPKFGSSRIVETIENVRSATDKIASSVNEQTAGCAHVVSATWEEFKRAKETHAAAGRLASAVEGVRVNAAKVDELVEELRSPSS